MPENQPAKFIQTRQHLRFVEFADFCRANRFLGICTGRPGVGKEASALAYSQWNLTKALLDTPRPKAPPAKLQNCHTAFLAAEISCSTKRLNSGLNTLRNRFNRLVQDSRDWHEPKRLRQKLPPCNEFLELIIINQAHRLSLLCLDAINDFRLNNRIGIVLLGVPGFDRKVKLFDQVGNDVALYHEYTPPRSEELKQILELQWSGPEITVEQAAITVIEEVTSSNIQKALNVQAEIERVRRINSIAIISPELVKAATSSLLLEDPARSKC
ncbi:MAG: ATP-binding protein [Candidatus Obscuribacterales bacterium]|nr:ATP-binding protein [Candidatus Obscuribacterales bacterium]